MQLTRSLLNQSILFCRFSAAAYLDRDPKGEVGLRLINKEGTPKLTCDKRFSPENTDNKSDTEALVCFWNNDIVVAFRGTEKTFKDIFTDMNGIMVKNRDKNLGGKLHRGFQTAADSIYEAIKQYILSLQHGDEENANSPQRRLFLCGHSLGGALAVITATRLLNDPECQCPIAGVFTYGAPRVGDEDFAVAYRQTSLMDKTHMWVSIADPVGRVAPVAIGYRHVVPEQYTLENSVVRIANLDKEAETTIENSWITKVGAKVIPIGTILMNAWQTLDPEQHSVEASYLKQLTKVNL